MTPRTTFKDKIAYKLFGAVVSYAQCGEDLILEHIFNQHFKTDQITYLDIGANHPKIRNNTYKFYELGSQGVCVEPNPVLCKMLSKTRKRDRCLNIGVSTSESTKADFYLITPHTLSTFCKSDAEALQKQGVHKIDSVIQVPLKSINTILKENFSLCPDLISIDVEGLNEEIALSINLDLYRPKAFCIETSTYSDTNQSIKLQKIIDYFIRNNYNLYADTFINSIFIDGRPTLL
jgi:FkbM family methyltransferase